MSGAMSGARGSSLAELLVALTLLAMGGTLSARLLLQATREMESAELGLRAALFLSERWEGTSWLEGDERPAGPGLLIAEGAGAGARIRFEPPVVQSAPSGGAGGFLRARVWSLTVEPEQR